MKKLLLILFLFGCTQTNQKPCECEKMQKEINYLHEMLTQELYRHNATIDKMEFDTEYISKLTPLWEKICIYEDSFYKINKSR